MPAEASEAVTSRAGAWHQSSIASLLDGCSWQWALEHLVGLPAGVKPAAWVGTAMHAGIEAHENARQTWHVTNGGFGSAEGLPFADVIRFAEASLEDQWNAVDPAEVAHLAFDELRQRLHHSLEAWWQVPVKGVGVSLRTWLLDWEPVAVEEYFRHQLVDGALPIGGWADGIYRHKENGELIVVDHKSAKSFSNWNADGSGHRHQAAMYAVAAVLTYDLPSLPRVVYLVARTEVGKSSSFERARIVEVQPDTADVSELGVRIRAAQQLVDTSRFLPNPAYTFCPTCPYFNGCQVTGELRPPLLRITTPAHWRLSEMADT